MASLDLADIRTIVVTGGAGFVGSHLVDDLIAACPAARIRVLDAFTYAASMSNLDAAFATGRVTLQQGDVGNLDLVTDIVRDADLIIHAAAESHVERSFSVPERFSLANAIGTQVLVEAMARRRVPLMIHLSTAEVYGATREVVDESAPMAPDNPLAASKAAAEMLIAGLRQTYGLDIRVIRPVNLFGTRQNAEKLLPRYLELAAVGRGLPVHGDGLQRRSFLAIADLCAAVRAVIVRGAPNAAYNVSCEESYSVLDVARLVLDAVPDPVAGVSFMNGRPQNVGRGPLSTRAIEGLGWRPRISLSSALPALAEWYTGRIPRTELRHVLTPAPALAPRNVQAVTQSAGSGLFRSLERH